jgi:DNA-binding transcriptional ArsR family regulator
MTDPNAMAANALRASGLLKALANPHRLLILCHLAQGEMSVGALEQLLKLRQPTLSQQLARLREDALVETGGWARWFTIGSRAMTRAK